MNFATLFRRTFQESQVNATTTKRSQERRPNGVQRLYRVYPKEIRWKSSRPAGRGILAIESLCRVHRHAPGGSHCIASSLQTPTRVHCCCETALPKDMLIPHGLRKHFHAFSSFGRQVTAQTMRHQKRVARRICATLPSLPLPFESCPGIVEHA